MDDSRQTYPLIEAHAVVDTVLDVLRDSCRHIEIAGSVRRKKPWVHDIDLVVWPTTIELPAIQLGLFDEGKKSLIPAALLQTLIGSGWLEKLPEADYPKILKLSGLSVPTEIYLCEPDGSNFGALWQMRSGDYRFNAFLAERAIRLGMKYRAGYGVWKGDHRMDDDSEEGIFRTLQLMTPIPPEQRWGDVERFKGDHGT